MDDLFAILVVVVSLIGLAAKSNKKKKASGQTARQPARPAAVTAAASAPAPAEAPPPMQGEVPHTPAPHVHELPPQVAVTPHTPDIFSGSMNASTGEGFDPCHEEELTPQREPCMVAPRPAPPQPAPAPLSLSWTGDEMVKAVVMQEILRRPCERQRR